MIYEYPDIAEPIRQGDIFIGLPRTDISLKRILLVEEDGTHTETTWPEASASGQPVTVVMAIRPVFAIVASQDCDCTNGKDITLCEIGDFREVERKSKDTKAAKAWMRLITQHARLNQKWFYLPPDERLGFGKKMAADFMMTIRIDRSELEELRNLRKGRLNEIADEHFRQRISEFFRRYPYDEWYSLNKDELETYRKDNPDAKPFPWQEQEVTTPSPAAIAPVITDVQPIVTFVEIPPASTETPPAIPAPPPEDPASPSDNPAS